MSVTSPDPAGVGVWSLVTSGGFLTGARRDSRLEQHQKDQAQEPANWGYTGDLGRISEQLAYVLASLGDRSAVDALSAAKR